MGTFSQPLSIMAATGLAWRWSAPALHAVSLGTPLGRAVSVGPLAKLTYAIKRYKAYFDPPSPALGSLLRYESYPTEVTERSAPTTSCTRLRLPLCSAVLQLRSTPIQVRFRNAMLESMYNES